MNSGIEARLDGSQHIAVETQRVMATYLHIYYFISAFRIPASRKPALLSPLLSLSLSVSHIDTHVHTHILRERDSIQFEMHLGYNHQTHQEQKKVFIYRLFLHLEFWRAVFDANGQKKCK